MPTSIAPQMDAVSLTTTTRPRAHAPTRDGQVTAVSWSRAMMEAPATMADHVSRMFFYYFVLFAFILINHEGKTRKNVYELL